MHSDDIEIEMFRQSIRPYELQDFQEKIDNCCKWLEDECGLRIVGRIQKYKKYIKNIDRYRGVYSNESYYALQAFNEMNQILYIYEHLSDQNNTEFKNTLKQAIKGIFFRNDPNRNHEDNARNHLFELAIASDFVKSGYKVDLTQRADIVVTNMDLLVECKRVKSLTALKERAQEAVDQINKDSSGFDGIVYIDITELFDELHQITVVDEQGSISAMMGLSEDIDIARMMDEELIKFLGPIVINERGFFVDLVKDNEKVHSITLLVNFVGLHLSIVHEDAILGRAKYLIDDVDIEKI
ncbi:TPA: hypothetical protein ACOJRH_005185 [Vibrio harveyi]|uniref:hypothetical protein n=1 Tax=Vibrio harveyi TaxID=669 RepID=UPI00390A398B